MTKITPLAALIVALGASEAWAQPPQRVVSGDVNVMIGWLARHARPDGSDDYFEWRGSVFGATGAGWHWTDHLKTEIDFGAGTQAKGYANRLFVANGLQTYRTIERRSSRRIVGLSQQYQFFRNAWFHPHVAAGANLTWEDRTDYLPRITVYDPISRGNRVLEEERKEHGTDFAVRPFVAAGFKAYMTPRSFFRSDLRVAFDTGIDKTLLRLGFGFDF